MCGVGRGWRWRYCWKPHIKYTFHHHHRHHFISERKGENVGMGENCIVWLGFWIKRDKISVPFRVTFISSREPREVRHEPNILMLWIHFISIFPLSTFILFWENSLRQRHYIDRIDLGISKCLLYSWQRKWEEWGTFMQYKCRSAHPQVKYWMKEIRCFRKFSAIKATRPG